MQSSQLIVTFKRSSSTKVESQRHVNNSPQQIKQVEFDINLF